MQRKLIITNDGSHSLFVEEINECYHSRHGAIVEAEHVFIRNGLSAVNKTKLNILEIGFGTGLNALLTAQKAESRKVKIKYHAMELYPLNKEDYSQLNFTELIGVEKDALLELHKNSWEEEHKTSDYFSIIKNNISLQEYFTEVKFELSRRSPKEMRIFPMIS